MPSKPSDRSTDACHDIVMNTRRIERFVAGLTLDAFTADDRTHLAVVRCLEMISEACRRLSPEARGRYPHIPWRQIMDAGNIYRHAYDSVSLDIVWLTVHDELPLLVAAAEAELGRAPDR